jgi:hypothetical protein
MSCGDLRASGAASPSATAASMAFGEPRAASAIGETLPKWVENDRKVRSYPEVQQQCASAAGGSCGRPA